MLKHPLLPVTLCYAGGAVVAALAPVPLPLGFLLALGLAVGAWLCERGRPWLLGGLLFTAGAVNLTRHTAILSPHDLRHTAGEAPLLTTLRGRLATTPELRIDGEGSQERRRSLAILETEALDQSGTWLPAAGRVLVRTPAPLDRGFFQGCAIEVFGVLKPPDPPAAPGLFDARAYYRWHGIHYVLEARQTNDWRLSPGAPQPSRPPWSDRFIAWSQYALALGLPEEDEALRLLWAMTLGWRAGLPDEVAAPFMQTGTMHIFAISGLHITLIAGILVALLRTVQVPRAATGLLVLPALWFYTGATGWQPSAVRSTLMMTVVIAGWALKRPGDLLNSLAGAGLLLLLWDPRQLFQAGFQLSFFVVLAMALLVPPFDRLRERWLGFDPLLPAEVVPPWRRRLQARAMALTRMLAISLAAWLGSLPLIAYYFHLVTPVSLLANLVIVPLSALALMSNLGSLAVAAWWPALATVFNHGAWFWMSLMVWLCDRAALLPAAYFHVQGPSLPELVASYTLLVAVAAGWWRHPRLRWFGILSIATLSCSGGWRVLQDLRESTLVLLPLDGGHAIWVDARGRARDLLIDCGNAEAAERIVVPFLHAQGVDRLPNLALTHGDIRHAGGSLIVETNLRPARLWTSPVRFRSATYRDYVDRFAREPSRLARVARGDSIWDWRVLHPDATDRFSRADDSALVLLGTCQGVRVLLLADLGPDGQAALLEREPDLRADLLIAGLPAQGQPLTDELLDAVQPQLILVADDEYPATARAPPAIRSRLAGRETRTIYTSDSGALTLRMRNHDWTLHALRPVSE